jgi:hypothetical protein
MLDLCYLHGFVVRENRDDATERCVQFFADEPTPEAEGEAFRKAWAFLRDSRPCALYYYSPYERTTLAQLARRHPAVCSEEVRALFDNDDAVDLYHDAVRPHTEWPTRDFSVKTLARMPRLSLARPAPRARRRSAGTTTTDEPGPRTQAAHPRLQRGRLPRDARAARCAALNAERPSLHPLASSLPPVLFWPSPPRTTRLLGQED